MSYYPLLWKFRLAQPAPYAPGERWFHRVDIGETGAEGLAKVFAGVHAVGIGENCMRVDVTQHFKATTKIDEDGVVQQVELSYVDDTMPFPYVENAVLELTVVMHFSDEKRYKTEDHFRQATLSFEHKTLVLIHQQGVNNLDTVHMGPHGWNTYNGEESDKFFHAKKDEVLPERNEKVNRLLSVFGFLEDDMRDIARKAGVKPPPVTSKEEMSRLKRESLAKATAAFTAGMESLKQLKGQGFDSGALKDFDEIIKKLGDPKNNGGE